MWWIYECAYFMSQDDSDIIRLLWYPMFLVCISLSQCIRFVSHFPFNYTCRMFNKGHILHIINPASRLTYRISVRYECYRSMWWTGVGYKWSPATKTQMFWTPPLIVLIMYPYNMNICNTAMHWMKNNIADIELTKITAYLAIKGKLCGVYCKYVREYWPYKMAPHSVR